VKLKRILFNDRWVAKGVYIVGVIGSMNRNCKTIVRQYWFLALRRAVTILAYETTNINQGLEVYGVEALRAQFFDQFCRTPSPLFDTNCYLNKYTHLYFKREYDFLKITNYLYVESG